MPPIAELKTERPDMEVAAANASGSDIAAKRFVAGNKNAITLPAATTTPVFGLTRVIQTNGRTGSVQIRGKGIAVAGVGGVTAGARVMPEAATGKGAIWTSGNAIIGIAQETVIADAEFEIELGLGATAQ